jgi:hypothetical protein
MHKIHVFLFLLAAATMASAQTTAVGWQRSEPAARPLELFHSQHVSMLPTAETLQKGDLEFEVSHRFSTPVSKGYHSFYGLDGPANIRLALGYAVSNRLLITVGRTNVYDNLELQLKYKALQIPNDLSPLLISVRGGAAYNGEIFDPVKNNSRRYQYYGQLIVNTLIHDKIGVGLVPSYLYNAHIFCMNPQYSLTLGTYLQYYVSPNWSLFAEWNPTVSGWRQSHNSFTLGLEVETGGHFFKILLTNNNKLNSSQYIAGADHDFWNGDLHLGFVITRLIN